MISPACRAGDSPRPGTGRRRQGLAECRRAGRCAACPGKRCSGVRHGDRARQAGGCRRHRPGRRDRARTVPAPRRPHCRGAADGRVRSGPAGYARLTRMSYAGDITPQEAWKLLSDNPEAVLVDVRTDAEWRFVGVPDLSSLGRDVGLHRVEHHRRAPQRELPRRTEGAGPGRFGGAAGGLPVSLGQPLDRGRRGRDRGGHRPVLQRAGRLRGQSRRAWPPRGNRLAGNRFAVETGLKQR